MPSFYFTGFWVLLYYLTSLGLTNFKTRTMILEGWLNWFKLYDFCKFSIKNEKQRWFFKGGRGGRVRSKLKTFKVRLTPFREKWEPQLTAKKKHQVFETFEIRKETLVFKPKLVEPLKLDFQKLVPRHP